MLRPSPRRALASRSTATMLASGPSRSANARVKAPSPAPRSAHLPPRSPPTPSLIRSTRSSCFNFVADPGRHLRHERAHLVGVVGDQKRVDAIFRDEGDELLGVHVAGVQDSADGPRVTSGGERRLVDPPAGLEQLRFLEIAVGRHPSVAQAPDQRQHPRPVGAEPDPNRVRGHWSRVRARELIELAFEPDPVLPAPQEADHLDRPSSADTDSAAVRAGPLYALIPSQKPPAPRPSSSRPPLRMSSVAAALASIAGGRSGTFATSGKTVILSVLIAMAVSSVQVTEKRRWYGRSCTPA